MDRFRDGAFTVFYVEGSRVTAALTVGRGEDLDFARSLITSRRIRGRRHPRRIASRRMNRLFRASVGAALACACVSPAAASAAPVPVTAAGSAAVTTAVTNFRTAMGAPNGAAAGPLASGRRDITWDGVPDANSAPNLLAPDFFNTTSPRGVVLVGGDGGLQVSADSVNTTSTLVEFGNINNTYVSDFTTFSAERLFSPLGTNVTDVRFYVPGTSRPATVAGFGAVFTDVDVNNRSAIFAIGQFGQVLDGVYAPAADGDVSFAGVGFDAGERIASVRIVSGIERLGSDDAVSDKVVLDDFIYGEPQQPRLSISDAGTITEGDDGSQTATFTVTRDLDTTKVFSVPYATLGDGAGEGEDYTGKAGTIAFNSGEVSRTIEVSVLGDKIDEVDEAFRVVLLDDGQAWLADGDGRAVIADNDPPGVSPTVTVTPTPTPTPAPSTGYDPAKDQTPPKLTVTGYPKGKKCARRDFTLRVTVVEDGLSALRVRLDSKTLTDRAVAAATTERFKLSVPAKRLKKGRHTIRVTARDRGRQRGRPDEQVPALLSAVRGRRREAPPSVALRPPACRRSCRCGRGTPGTARAGSSRR